MNKYFTLPQLIIVLVAIIVLVLGTILMFGGGYLLLLNGSGYFVVAGALLFYAGALLLIGKSKGALIYLVVYVGSIIWTVVDVGWDFWPWVSRLFMLTAIGIAVALCFSLLTTQHKKVGYIFAVIGMVAIVGSTAWAFMYDSLVRHPFELTSGEEPATESFDWKHWGGTSKGTRYARSEQITPDTVSSLNVAWTYRSGDIPLSPDGFGREDQNTPLQVGGDLFICTPTNKVIALNLDTGKERWRFDPHATAPNWQRCRGLGYFDSVDNSAAEALSTSSKATDCVRKVVLTTVDGRLFGINADNGQLCKSFGRSGVVDLKDNMGEVQAGFYTLTSAPLVAGKLIVVGGRVYDNYSTGEPGGVIRAYDADSGVLVWAWDPGNSSTNRLPPKGETYKRGTPNVWSAMAYDPELNLIFMPTGNATPDFWGGHRSNQDDEYSSSIIALDAKTGRVRWSFQTVHHDLWDYDVPSQPLLTEITGANGERQAVVVQTTKTGQIFMLDRATGKPIADVQEQSVPVDHPVDGERYSATQPFSTGMPAIGTEPLKESDMWGATPIDQMLCRIQFMKTRYQGAFTQPGTDTVLQWPGVLGGMNWGSASVDERRKLLFINDIRLGTLTKLIPRSDVDPSKAGGIESGLQAQLGTPYALDARMFMSALGVPCQKPPYGTLTAIDLESRSVVWQAPLGTLQDTGPFGIKMHLAIPIGMPSIGGTLATSSGLVFFAGSQDFNLRAFESTSGKEVWKARLPVGSQGTPITVTSPVTGKQFVIISAGGARGSAERGDYVIAYALSD